MVHLVTPEGDSQLQVLRPLSERTEFLIQSGLEALLTFWDSGKGYFFRSAAQRSKISVTSSCFCLFAVLQNSITRDIAPANRIRMSVNLEQLARNLLNARWTSEDLDEYNIYTTPIVLSALLELTQTASCSSWVEKLYADPTYAPKFRSGVMSILDNLKVKGAASYKEYHPSAFLSYWCFIALRNITRSKVDVGPRVNELEGALRGLLDWSESEMFRQIAYHSSSDSASFDPIQLGFAMKLYLSGCRHVGRKPNFKIVSRSLAVVFSSQLEDGLWPKSHPIFHYPEHGNVYTFSFEMLDVVLPEGNDLLPPDLLQPYIAQLERVITWAEQNVIIHEDTVGWRSNHLKFLIWPEAWSTATVFIALGKVKQLVDASINEKALRILRGQVTGRSDNNALENDPTFYDSDIPGLKLGLKSVLKDYLVGPHVGPSPHEKKFSAVFYGPPGTSKTSLAKRLARRLGWPFVYLQTSDFAIEGVSHVPARARDIFDLLGLLQNAVVLFDECEEFVRDRKDKALDQEGRMITTSMLSFIQELREKKRVIFIVATNYLRAFDNAIVRRGGRFDLILVVGPPSLIEKQRLFRDTLTISRPSLNDDKRNSVCEQFGEFIEGQFDNLVQFFTFHEWLDYVKVAIDIADKYPERADRVKAWRQELTESEKSITIRDDVRTEYLKYRGQSRIA